MPNRPLQFIADIAKDSSLEYSETEPSQKIRGGLVVGLDGDPATALDQCLAAPDMPTLGSAITVGNRTLYFRRLIIKGNDTATDSANVLLVYDNNGAGQNSAVTITFRGYEQEYSSNRIPGTRESLWIDDWHGSATKTPIPGDLAMARFAYPMRQVTVSGIKQGKTPDPGTYDGNSGAVNQADFLGLKPGWWRVTDGGCSSSLYAGYFSFTMSAITKNIEDWSQYFTLFSQRYGIYAELTAADEKKLHAAKYKHGFMASVPGAIRIGPYPPIDFDPLFTQLPQAAQHKFSNILGQTSHEKRSNV